MGSQKLTLRIHGWTNPPLQIHLHDGGNKTESLVEQVMAKDLHMCFSDALVLRFFIANYVNNLILLKFSPILYRTIAIEDMQTKTKNVQSIDFHTKEV